MKNGIYFLTLILFCSCKTPGKNTINIAAASNMQFALDSILVHFEKEFGIDCQVTYGASGMITNQIKNGAPYDIFFSANMTFPQNLYHLGFGNKPQVYAQGQLILMVNSNQKYNLIEEILFDKKIKRIGIADLKTAPYGMAAKEYINNQGWWDKLESKIIIGENVGQINAYLKSNAIDAGFTSASYSAKLQNTQCFKIDQRYYQPINQAYIVLNSKKHQENIFVKELTSYMKNERAQQILTYFGYRI